MIILIDFLLVMAAFLSANIALMWGELGSYGPRADKSGLAGLGGAFLFMMMRWPILAVALAWGSFRGGYVGLPGSRSSQAIAAVLIHLAIGVLTYKSFEWVVAAIQHDNPGPLKVAWVFGLVLPLVTFGVAFFALHRDWIPNHPVITALLALALVLSHWGGWRAGYRRPTPAAEVSTNR